LALKDLTYPNLLGTRILDCFRYSSRFLLQPIFHVQNSIMTLLWFEVSYSHLKSSFMLLEVQIARGIATQSNPHFSYRKKKNTSVKEKGKVITRTNLFSFRWIEIFTVTPIQQCWVGWLICNRCGYLQWLVVGYK
jgi:hypothetical protein